MRGYPLEQLLTNGGADPPPAHAPDGHIVLHGLILTRSWEFWLPVPDRGPALELLEDVLVKGGWQPETGAVVYRIARAAILTSEPVQLSASTKQIAPEQLSAAAFTEALDGAVPGLSFR